MPRDVKTQASGMIGFEKLDRNKGVFKGEIDTTDVSEGYAGTGGQVPEHALRFFTKVFCKEISPSPVECIVQR